MTPAEAQALGQQLLRDHGLDDWHFAFDRARSRLGACHFGRREISLSRHFVKMNEAAEVEATVLHEIAHALCGPGAGHGPAWQATAHRIGAPVQATNISASMPEPRWHLRCLNCRTIVAKRHRRSLDLTRTRCRSCGIERGHLEWRASNIQAVSSSPLT